MKSKKASAQRMVFLISQTQFRTFGEISETGKMVIGDSLYKGEDETQARKFLFSPTNSLVKEEITLYWEGEDQVIPGGVGIYDYFKSKGYEVIKNAHPSILINAMSVLSDKKLKEAGIPHWVDVALPLKVNQLFDGEAGESCFFGVYRTGGIHKLTLFSFRGGWGGQCAFLLHKIKKKK